MASQSLRKSGLCRQEIQRATGDPQASSRNPFVNQVFVVIHGQSPTPTFAVRSCRNPFVNQVFVVTHDAKTLNVTTSRRRNPFVNQVFVVTNVHEGGKYEPDFMSQSLRKSGLCRHRTGAEMRDYQGRSQSLRKSGLCRQILNDNWDLMIAHPVAIPS